MNSLEYIYSKNRGDYQRDNFDEFLRKIKFSFSRPAIHIAGTNGKGSVAHFLHDIYMANGYKVGLFTSPDDPLEMSKICGKCIEISYIDKKIDEYRKLIDKYDLSTFEIQVFITLSWFNDNNVDIAIIECGMGGEYDATNIFAPVLSIITSIDFEHAEFLGASLSEIALHKAGIIKEEVPVLIGNIEGDALTVIVDKCKRESSKLVVVDRYHNLHKEDGYSIFDYRPYHDLKIPSLASYRVYNAGLAIEATNILMDSFPVQEDKLKEGLASSKLKCRFEVVNKSPLIMLDGAHNPEGMISLRKEIDLNYGGKGFNIKVVFASFRDKNISLMLPEISLIGEVTLTTFENGRARDDSDYFLYLDDYKYNCDYKALIDSLISEAEENTMILVTGSLTFTYVVRNYLKEKGLLNA